MSTITSTASFTVRLPSSCLMPSFGDPAAPCSWRIERSGDVVWCARHGGVDAGLDGSTS